MRHLFLFILLGLMAGVIPGQAGQTTMANPTGPIVLLGASYAAGWDLSSIAGAPVVNKGVGGEQSFEMLARFERDVVAARPRAVIIWGLVNDITRAQDAAAATARTKETYARMVALAREHRIEPVLATEVTMCPPPTWFNMFASWAGAVLGKPSYQDQVNQHVIATNRYVVELARREGLLLLDLQTTLGTPGGRRRPEYTQADGSHLTPRGYAALTAYAKPLLDTHFKGRQSGS